MHFHSGGALAGSAVSIEGANSKVFSGGNTIINNNDSASPAPDQKAPEDYRKALEQACGNATSEMDNVTDKIDGANSAVPPRPRRPQN